MLVWFEQHGMMERAILREKQIKKWRRAWKIDLMNRAIRTGVIWPSTLVSTRWADWIPACAGMTE